MLKRRLTFFRTIKHIVCEECLAKSHSPLLNRLFGATFTCNLCGRTNDTWIGDEETHASTLAQ